MRPSNELTAQRLTPPKWTSESGQRSFAKSQGSDTYTVSCGCPTHAIRANTGPQAVVWPFRVYPSHKDYYLELRLINYLNWLI
ncbi:hypothetical protein GCM10027185_58890 [Spirosoma pulveris]